jgi:hypothetical protein
MSLEALDMEDILFLCVRPNLLSLNLQVLLYL